MKVQLETGGAHPRQSPETLVPAAIGTVNEKAGEAVQVTLPPATE